MTNLIEGPERNCLITNSLKSFSQILWPRHVIDLTGHGLEIWICGCSLFYKRELWASKSAGAHSTKSLKISGGKRWCPKASYWILNIEYLFLIFYCAYLKNQQQQIFDIQHSTCGVSLWDADDIKILILTIKNTNR